MRSTHREHDVLYSTSNDVPLRCRTLLTPPLDVGVFCSRENALVPIHSVASHRDSAADALLETCVGALDLLLDLSENCTALMSPYASVVGDLVLGWGGNLCVLVCCVFCFIIFCLLSQSVSAQNIFEELLHVFWPE